MPIILMQRSPKGLEDRGCFSTVFFQGFNCSLKCRYIGAGRMRCERCVVLILVRILIHEVLGLRIIGIYGAAR